MRATGVTGPIAKPAGPQLARKALGGARSRLEGPAMRATGVAAPSAMPAGPQLVRNALGGAKFRREGGRR